MTTLITGGTGFIGAEIARMLVDSGDEVHIAHRSGNLGRLEGISDRVHLHQFDLSVPGSASTLLSEVKPTTLFHFGAILTAQVNKTHRRFFKQTQPVSLKPLRLRGLREPSK